MNNDLNGFTIRNVEDYPGAVIFYIEGDSGKIKLLSSDQIKYITTENDMIILTDNANAYNPNVTYTVV